jgi:hypothetical protein
MLVRNLALVNQSKSIHAAELNEVAAALQKQITRDVSPIWNLEATINIFHTLKAIPVGYWPIIIKDNIHQAGAGGFHTTKHNQPFALVEAGPDWIISTSHETIEMLVDPSGNHIVTGDSIKPGQGRVQYLLEACDPCEAGQYAYSINGITVSDFITPHFHDPVAASGVRYSFTGSITAPRQILPEGYISWYEPASQTIWQAFNVHNQLKFKELGSSPGGFSLREFVDARTNVKAYFETLNENKILGNTNTSTRQKSSEAAGVILEEALRKLGHDVQ